VQIKRPKLDGFTGFIDQWLQDDLNRPPKQRHTAKRIFERLRDEHQFQGGYTTIKTYVREHVWRSREMFVPLPHAPGLAQADYCQPDQSTALSLFAVVLTGKAGTLRASRERQDVGDRRGIRPSRARGPW